MKILILGATGNSGRRLVNAGLCRGHEVTAFVRNTDKLVAQLDGSPPENLRIVSGDVYDATAVSTAMQGQEVVINAAGNVNDGDRFVDLIRLLVKEAESVMGVGGRLWLFAGAALLDIPDSDLMGVDLPKVPAQFQSHKKNYELVRATSLNWSMLCPGPMISALDGKARTDLRLSIDVWPFGRPGITKYLPKIALLLVFARNIGAMTISYEDAAAVILDNLSSDSPFSRKRVGVALPVGLRASKKLDV